MFDDRILQSKESHDVLLGYGNKLNEIAGELQYWVKQSQEAPPLDQRQSPKRPISVLTRSPPRRGQ